MPKGRPISIDLSTLWTHSNNKPKNQEWWWPRRMAQWPPWIRRWCCGKTSFHLSGAARDLLLFAGPRKVQQKSVASVLLNCFMRADKNANSNLWHLFFWFTLLFTDPRKSKLKSLASVLLICLWQALGQQTQAISAYSCLISLIAFLFWLPQKANWLTSLYSYVVLLSLRIRTKHLWWCVIYSIPEEANLPNLTKRIRPMFLGRKGPTWTDNHFYGRHKIQPYILCQTLTQYHLTLFPTCTFGAARRLSAFVLIAMKNKRQRNSLTILNFRMLLRRYDIVDKGHELWLTLPLMNSCMLWISFDLHQSPELPAANEKWQTWSYHETSKVF